MPWFLSYIIVVLKWMIVLVFTMLHRSQNAAKLMYDVGCVSTLVLKKVTVKWLSLLLIVKHIIIVVFGLW